MPTVRTHTRIQGLMSIVHVSTIPVLGLVRTPGLLRCRSSIPNLDSCGLWQTGGDGAMAVEHANVFRARADAGPDSDYDLLVVVVRDDAPLERRRSRLAYETLRGTGS